MSGHWRADGNVVRGDKFELLICPVHNPATLNERAALARRVAELLRSEDDDIDGVERSTIEAWISGIEEGVWNPSENCKRSVAAVLRCALRGER